MKSCIIGDESCGCQIMGFRAVPHPILFPPHSFGAKPYGVKRRADGFWERDTD